MATATATKNSAPATTDFPASPPETITEGQGGTYNKAAAVAMFESGNWTRSQISKWFNVRYQTVFAVTKNKEGAGGSTRARVNVTVDLGDGEGKREMSRGDFVRYRFYEQKKTRNEIAKELSELQGENVPYQIVYGYTKPDADEDGDGEAKPRAKKATKAAAPQTAELEDTSEDEDIQEIVLGVDPDDSTMFPEIEETSDETES